jgi:N-acetylmuramoyl-L-alanine amidase
MRRAAVSVPPVVALLLAGAATASAAPSAPADFEQRAPVLAAPPAQAAGAAAASAGGALRTTAPVRAPRPFDLLGLRSRGGDAHVAVRVRRADGRWSRWGEIPHGEDVPARRSRDVVSGPLWTGRAVAYQLRARRLPRDLRLHFVAVPRHAAPLLAVRSADGDAPPIVPRSQWDPSDSCPPRAAPKYGRVDFSVVHHTESLVSYSREAAAAMVLGICRFHRNGNGWLDIGYNLLVDRFGTVYEGRAGGVEQPVIGAHAGGWNSVAAGVAVIGSFSSRRPPLVAQEALTTTLAWKLSLAGVPATGTIAKVSSGGAENRWRSGARVPFQRVSGHRDADGTDCPGGALYALLPRLRAQVAAQLAPPSDLLTSAPIGGVLAQGAPAYLTGRLALADGRRPSGAQLQLQRREEGTWTTLDTISTGADGIWTAQVPATVNSSFRVVSARMGVTSPAVSAEVAAGVAATVSPQLLRPGRRVTVRGSTTPAKAQVSLVVERQAKAGGSWRRLRATTLETDAGAYATTLQLRSAGLYRFAVATRADDDNAAGAAPVRTAQVRAAKARKR